MAGLKEIPAIDNITSEGIEISFIEQDHALVGVIPRKGAVNQYDLVNPLLSESLQYYNHPDRLRKPLKNVGGKFVEISFQEAFEEIRKNISNRDPHESVFFAGARLTNEEQYLIQRVVRMGLKTNAVTSFHYMNRGENFSFDKNDIVPFAELSQASRIYLLGFDSVQCNPVLFGLLDKIKEENGIEITQLHDFTETPVTDHYTFFKALNHYLIISGLAKGIFVEGLGKNYETYRQALVKEDFDLLLRKINLQESTVIRVINEVMRETAPVFLYAEKELTGNAIQEMLHFMMLTEKQAKTASGLLGIKECCNSQGLFDMGIFPDRTVGGKLSDSKAENMDIYRQLQAGQFKNCFIFGEDPVGCSKGSIRKQVFSEIPFLVVQDYFLTETAKQAAIVLPATFPIETGGSFTNTTRIPQTFQKGLSSGIEWDNLQQLSGIGENLGLPKLEKAVDIFLEYISFFNAGCNSSTRHYFKYSTEDSPMALFSSGCDHFQKLCMKEKA